MFSFPTITGSTSVCKPGLTSVHHHEHGGGMDVCWRGEISTLQLLEYLVNECVHMSNSTLKCENSSYHHGMGRHLVVTFHTP